MTAAEALAASIVHWRANAVAATPWDASAKAEDCALCGLFLEGECRGCPVMARTREVTCKGSPFVAASLALQEWRVAASDEGAGRVFRAAAVAEAAFLEGLR